MKKQLINRKFLIIIAICFIAFSIVGFSIFFKSPSPPSPPQYILAETNNIVGNFVSETDSDWRLVFDATGKCYSYYGAQLTQTFDFSISNSTPQCGCVVLVDENQETSYLQLTDVADGSNVCYEVNGIGTTLSLTLVGTDKLVLLTRQ